MNQRLIAQSGTFVMPGVLDSPIEEIAPGDLEVRLDSRPSKGRHERALSHEYT
jgi:hypothetical protein